MLTKDQYFDKNKYKLYVGDHNLTYFLYGKSGAGQNLFFRRTPAGRGGSDVPDWSIHNSLNESTGWYNESDGSVDTFRLKRLPPYTASTEQIQEYDANYQPQSEASSTTGGKKSRKASRKSKKKSHKKRPTKKNKKKRTRKH